MIDGFLARFESDYGDSWWSWDHLEPAASLLPTAWALVDWLIDHGDDREAVRLLSRFAGAAIVFSGASRVADLLSERIDVIGSFSETEQAEVLALYSLAGIGSMRIEHSVAGVVALFELGLPPSPPQSFAMRSAALGAMTGPSATAESRQFSLDLLEDARAVAAQTDSHYEQAAVEAFIGWRHLLAGAWEDAEQASRTGLRFVAPNNVWHVVLSCNLGLALVRQGRSREALEVARGHPDFGRYYYMGDLLGLVEILALAADGDQHRSYDAFAAMDDRVLASNHPGHRSDLALVWAWLCAFDEVGADASWIADGLLLPRGPHTMQLVQGLEVSVPPFLDRDETTDVLATEAWLVPRLAEAAEVARSRAATSGVA